MQIKLVATTLCFCLTLNPLFGQDVQRELTALVDSFFYALERQDTTALRNQCIEGAYDHYLSEKTVPHRIGSRPSATFNFRPDQIIKERAKEKGVVVMHDRNIGMAWVPYDLWVNDVYTHCGIDVFSFLKSQEGWKIASITFSMVTEGCR